jgi:DNA-binding NarL/FixJ family response regulator
MIGGEEPTIITEIDVTAIGSLDPHVLVLDVDALETDPLETIRMTRFLLRSGVIAIFTGQLEQSWGLACHLAGANCVLSSSGGEDRAAIGLLHGIRSGCFTDPAFETRVTQKVS